MLKIWWLLRSRPMLHEAWLFSIIGAALSFVSDVLAVFKPVLVWLLVSVFVLLVAVVLLNAVLLAPRTVTEVKGWARMKRTDKSGANPVPSPLPLTADATLFLFITLLFSLLTFAGQVMTNGRRTPEEADAHGFYATLIPAIGEVQRSLSGVERDLGEIKGTLKNVKLETSDDPRKELANLGVAWGGDGFLAAVKDGDERIVRLFLSGGIDPQTAESQGRPLPVMLALNQRNPGVVLDLLVGAGLDPSHQFPLASGMGPKTITLMSRAIEKGNVPLVRALVQHRADLNRPIETFGAMGLARQTYPLAAAIYWKQYEIANLLLDAGADNSAGDYAAYRELRATMGRPGSNAAPAELNALVARVAPIGSSGDKIELELRLEEVDRELNDVALKSLRASPGSSERVQYDRRYEELQQERAKIRSALGIG